MNLFELFVKIGVDDQASNNLSNITDKLGNGLKTAAKIGTAAVSAAAAGISALTKAAVDNYAEYEQLVGGVETLFKDSADTLMQYADNAYKTAGLSANEYMSTVTSFSASLIQSLGGNTKEAVEYAQMAITDMADNANKMGSSIESIQVAYQGFAKQQYNLLDNLKLGYGGTQKEMYRLLQDAQKIDETFDAVFYIDEQGHLTAQYADIVEAIHIVQTEMGITGTTALEASETISGSVASMKSAWQNLITGIADENANFDVLISNFVESVGTAADNILPRIEKTLGGIGQLIEKLAPIIIEKLPSVVETVIPSLLSAAVQMVDSVVGITPSLVGEIVLALIDSAPLLIESGIALIDSLIQAFTDSKDTLVDGAFQIVDMLIVAIGDLLPDLVVLGGDLLISIIDGIIENLPTLVETALTLIEKLASGVTQYLPELSETIIGLLEYIVSVLTDDKNLDVILDSALAIMLALAGFIVDVLPELVDAATQIIVKLVEYLFEPDNMEKLGQGALDIVLALAEALIKSAGSILGGVGKIISTITDAIANTDWKKTGEDIVNAIWDGLKEMWKNVTKWFDNNLDNIVGGFEDAVNTIKRLLGLEVEETSNTNAGVTAYSPSGTGMGYQTYSRDANRDKVAGVVINQNIYSQAQSAADLAQETQWEANRAWITQSAR